MIWFYLEWNMTDKELLELAARAVGIELPKKKQNHWFSYSDDYGFQWMNADGSAVEKKFNPLNDDGDALRLAVKLDMLINPDNGTINTCSATGGFADVFEYIAGDKLAATRRAIVRAAAAIGEKL